MRQRKDIAGMFQNVLYSTQSCIHRKREARIAAARLDYL